MKRLIRLLLVVFLFLGMLYIGGYSWSKFAHDTELKSPIEVYAPLWDKISHDVPRITLPTYIQDTETIPGFTTKDPDNSDPSDPSDSTNTDFTTPSDPTETDISEVVTSETEEPSETKEPDKTNKISFNHNMNLFVSINGNVINFNTSTSLEFIKWIVSNYTEDARVKIEEKEVEPSETVEPTYTSSPLSTSEPSEAETTPIPETSRKDNSEVVYNDVLQSLDDLDALVDSINVVDVLPTVDGYERDDYEKPVKKYKLDGKSVNRNDYAWKTSPFFIEDKFIYICPYTGTIITDADDNKEDNDFGTLDYDHIVPLGSTWERGGYLWTNEERNAYAYDQWVGVDVLYSANRSKSDKGPCEYLPTENVEDYCYSWILICSKYNLSMTTDEMIICVNTIQKAYNNNETVQHLGGHNP